MRFKNLSTNGQAVPCRALRRVFAVPPVLIAWMLLASMGWAELVLVPAVDMKGIDQWKEGQSWGAGNFFSSNGSPVGKRVAFEGGEYEVYARIYTSPSAPADIRIWVNDDCLIPPMQAKVCKFGWVRVASVILPRSEAEIRVESPTPSQASNHSFAALAFCSTPMDDRIGRVIQFTEWLRNGTGSAGSSQTCTQVGGGSQRTPAGIAQQTSRCVGS